MGVNCGLLIDVVIRFEANCEGLTGNGPGCAGECIQHDGQNQLPMIARSAGFNEQVCGEQDGN